ncbi:hypothetical protein OH77DRAFT_1432387 [Trametes cingulata]|nr:hypothetical protein OH77DRAFT_1432387 [Trametes cingulata]
MDRVLLLRKFSASSPEDTLPMDLPPAVKDFLGTDFGNALHSRTCGCVSASAASAVHDDFTNHQEALYDPRHFLNAYEIAPVKHSPTDDTLVHRFLQLAAASACAAYNIHCDQEESEEPSADLAGRLVDVKEAFLAVQDACVLAGTSARISTGISSMPVLGSAATPSESGVSSLCLPSLPPAPELVSQNHPLLSLGRLPGATDSTSSSLSSSLYAPARGPAHCHSVLGRSACEGPSTSNTGSPAVMSKTISAPARLLSKQPSVFKVPDYPSAPRHGKKSKETVSVGSKRVRRVRAPPTPLGVFRTPGFKPS